MKTDELKREAREARIAKRGKFHTKTFAELTESEKWELVELVATQLGLIRVPNAVPKNPRRNNP